MRGMTVHVRLGNRPDVSDEELAAYVADAVQTWGGQRRPMDPLFYTTPVTSVVIGTTKFVIEEAP
jgi:hypothetical protein